MLDIKRPLHTIPSNWTQQRSFIDKPQLLNMGKKWFICGLLKFKIDVEMPIHKVKIANEQNLICARELCRPVVCRDVFCDHREPLSRQEKVNNILFVCSWEGCGENTRA